ncbi:MAG: 2Fe-2S iron-sulfur cluster binding domain-containing protein, partial [Chitinophagaceae bacterium]
VAQTLFYEQLQQWTNEYKGRFTIHYFFSDSANIENKRLTSFLLTNLLNQYSAAQVNPYIYLCGPYEYRLMATITLRVFGIKKERIRKEEFDPIPLPLTNRPPDMKARNVTIHIGGSKHILRVQYPKSIVAVAKENNVVVPYSCESGQCGSCAATCVSGKIWMGYNEVLTDDEIERGRVLTCVGFPIGGDAVIDFGNL